MHTWSIIFKVVVFFLGFTSLFWLIRINNLLPPNTLADDRWSIPVLFGAGNLIFSVLAAFVIQTQWTKWDRLIDATRGEVNSLRQLFILAHHFPIKERNEIRYRIYRYLQIYIDASNVNYYSSYDVFLSRSQSVDAALINLEDAVFSASKKHLDIGQLAFSYLTRAMEYREQKLQTTNTTLPKGIRIFVVFATGSVIIGTLFVPFVHEIYNYYFAVVVSALAFGAYLIIDDFEHPYRPGNYMLTARAHKALREEIKAKLLQRGFDIKKAEEEGDESDR